ncbi:MAG: PKD domain-containing protein [Propionibacteriaceae bacterium]|nr:PKD domain-containing protein [Propionibacteriaceae bacterium]
MNKKNLSLLRHLTSLLVGSLVAASGMIALHSPPEAAAVTLPTDPPTVTAEPLPTWQLNGVVWSTVVVGETAYVTGQFTHARPPGQAVGSPLSVPAGNIFAFDVTTGNPVPFSHSLNGQGLVVRANDDGSRLYVGGDFTTVNNVARGHIAAFDLTQPGAPLTSFNPSTDGQVRGFALIGNTVYAGGNFRSSNGQPRQLLSAYAAQSGNLLAWNPDGGSTGFVWTMVAAPDESRIIVGGSLTTLNGVSAYGMGALDAQTGETLPWAANQKLRTAGSNGAIDTLSTDGVSIFGAGYAFGAGATFEGTFSANPTTGEINWMNDCLGDTYDTFPMEGVLYSVGHEHNCTAVAAFPDTNPRNRWQNAMAERIDTPIGTYTAKDAYGWDFIGLKYTGLLHWFPTLAFGKYTSSRQAAWSIGGNGDYLVLAGEFPKVNGVNQQSLTRFAKRGVSTSAKPVIAGNATPSVVPLSDGKLRVIFDAMYDRDDASLLYDVYRNNGTKTTRVTTIGRPAATFWNTPALSHVDAGAPLDEDVRYQIRGRDGDGNDQWSAWSAYTRAGTGSGSVYAAAVASAGASHHWRLDELPGSSRLLDALGDAHGTPINMTLGVPGALTNESNSALTTKNTTQGLSTTEDTIGKAVSVEAWVNTSSSRGGRIVGIGNMPSGTSPATDRVLYLDNAGRVNFTISDTVRRTVTARNPIRDNQWHHVVGVAGARGMELFVDGIRVARDQRYTEATDFTGYWRIGSDSTVGFTNRPADAALAGQLDEIAIYPHALTLDEVQAHYSASGLSGGWGARATDAYGQAVINDAPDLLWRLGEPSGVVLDSSGSGNTGTVAGTVTRSQAGPITGSYAATFNGTNGMVVAQQGWSSPGPFTAEIWFKTNTVKGGKLIGFGNTTSGLSASYDRHIWMLNDGKLAFGTFAGAQQTVTTSTAYNDNQWHHVAATQGISGMRLYVDGIQVGSNDLSNANAYLGYWRIGGDRVWSGTSSYFSGALAEAAVYPSALSVDAVIAHFVAAGGSAPNRAPVAEFALTKDLLSIDVDGSASVDPDGPITSYEWNFGDGVTATGATASHTYDSPGTYQVSLKVQDPEGLSDTKNQPVTVVANVAPVAAFVATVAGHSATMDASSSEDPDGSISSYTWDFGDGGTGTGEIATHNYGGAGTFPVTLTVTDDRGATHQMTKAVQTIDIPNIAPIAEFTAAVNELGALFDASDSQDADGSISSYAWDFGDGGAGTGKIATHEYAIAGTYAVTLTVVDNLGATDSKSKNVTVAATPGIAVDTFERIKAGTWGAADKGGEWTIVNGAVRFSVSDGKGKIGLVNPGSGVTARLDGVNVTDADLSFDVSMDKAASGGGTYLTAFGRTVVGVGSYGATVRVLNTGAVQLTLDKTVGSTETFLSSQTVPGLTYSAGDTLRVRCEVVGSGPTALKAKVWSGSTEPIAWNLSATDSFAPLQVAGGVGLEAYVSGSAINVPVVFSFDNLLVVPA